MKAFKFRDETQNRLLQRQENDGRQYERKWNFIGVIAFDMLSERKIVTQLLNFGSRLYPQMMISVKAKIS